MRKVKLLVYCILFLKCIMFQVFRGCIQDYLELYQFDCTSSSDLMTSFSRSSGQPLEELFQSWIHNAGYPVISVLVKDNELTLKQQQFFADGTPGE